MRNYMQITIALMVSIFLQGACKAQKSGSTESQRKLEDFSAVSIAGGFGQSTLTVGAENSVTISTDTENLKYIITKVVNDNFEISIKDGAPRGIKVSFDIVYKSISQINNSGSTNLKCVGGLKTEALELNFSGSGNFNALDLSLNVLEVNKSGSSNMTLGGLAKKQIYAISGSGNVNAKTLAGENAEVAISGSAEVDLNINGEVETSTSGSGTVRNRN
jgi:Putative auto-transporter adhesin, head GIN domain